MKKQFLILIILFCGMFFGFSGKAQAKDWFIDNRVSSSGNGQNWTTAWKNFSNIQWASINPGDTLYISGGTTSQTYDEQLEILRSGTAGNPITIKIGQGTDHNGLVIIDRKNAVETQGLIVNSQHHIVISGQLGNDPTPRIRVTGTYYSGVGVSGNSYALDFSYLDITATAQVNKSGATYGFLIEALYNASNPLGSVHNCIFHNIESNIAFKVYSPGVATAFDWFTFHDNDLYDIEADYVYLTSGGVSIYNNKFRDKKPWISSGFHTDGIHGGGPYTKIYNNQFSNFVDSPDDDHLNSYIRFMPNDFFDYTDIGNVYIYNNTFTDKNTPDSTDAFRAIEMAFGGGDPSRQDALTAHDIYIANNTFIGIPFLPMILSFNGSYGHHPMASADVSNIYFVNNILKDLPNVNSLGQGSKVMMALGTGNGVTYGSWGEAKDVIIDYNLAYASSTSLYGTEWNIDGSYYTYAEMRTIAGCQKNAPANPIDPKLNLDYTLQSNSPAKDAGLSLVSKFTTDKAGATRDANWDIGAYEYTTTPTCLTPGDFTCNGYSLSDLQTMISIILGTDTTTSRTQADMSTPPDGLVNISDLQLLIKKVLGIN